MKAMNRKREALNQGRIRARIRQIRKAKRMTQSELAVKSGMNQVSICRIETGRIKLTIDDLASIARGLRIDLQELLCDGTSAQSKTGT